MVLHSYILHDSKMGHLENKSNRISVTSKQCFSNARETLKAESINNIFVVAQICLIFFHLAYNLFKKFYTLHLLFVNSVIFQKNNFLEIEPSILSVSYLQLKMKILKAKIIRPRGCKDSKTA